MSQQIQSLSDQEILTEILSSQKHITSVYNTYSNECVNQNLRNDLLTILREEHNIHSDVFSDMQKRGWYSPPGAESQMVNQARTKFQNIALSL